jgi:hypothetical protein
LFGLVLLRLQPFSLLELSLLDQLLPLLLLPSLLLLAQEFSFLPLAKLLSTFRF